ncbi:MAG TPA: N-acetylmuramoyl-L-alanine amidase [Lachnospiraceae bacterium]|nr:N-acetylmuramoyl-L-alanine amidase [Lachnospiraceae bacterium]
MEREYERRRMERNHAGRVLTQRERLDRRRRKRRRRIQKRMTMLLTVVCTVLLGLGGVHFVKANVLPASGETADMDEIQGESRPQEILGPVPLAQNEILEREDNLQHEKPFIIIDPGHGGTDTGCSREGVMESEINMQIANRLAGKLEGLGFETLLLREDNTTDVSLDERVARAEAEKADIFVSIHQNAYDEDVDEVKGIETWYYGESEGSRRLAELVHQGAVEKTGAVDRGIQNDQELYVLKNTSIPACLIETAFLSSRSDRNDIVSGEYQDLVAEGIAQGINTYFNPRTMYLTFDDGPSAENTTAVLDILKERNIRATFFVVGENVRKHPDVAKRIVEEGHTIGIHCYSHDYKQLYKSVDSYLEDFQKAYDAVYEITGVEAKLFRFPGGSVNAYNKDVGTEIIRKMTDSGYIYFDWNASLEDAVKQSTPEALVQNAVTSTFGRKKVVMLAHDVIYNTTQCLGELIDSFPEYEMKPLTEEVEPIQF